MNELNNLKPINEWFKKLDSRPIIISGPCSAESEEQVLNTARQLKEIDRLRYSGPEYGSPELVPIPSKVVVTMRFNG